MNRYEIIYADPPWSYADKGCNGAAEAHYTTMSFEDIARLPVGDLAADNAVLFMWATYPKFEEAPALMRRWGFTYKTIAFQWVKTYAKSGKPFFGLGRWTRGNTEPCLLGVRGKPRRVGNDVSQLLLSDYEESEVLIAPVTRHSAKPPEAREKIVRLMGDKPRVELFARVPTPGWDVWGNEVESSVSLAFPPTPGSDSSTAPNECPGHEGLNGALCGVCDAYTRG